MDWTRQIDAYCERVGTAFWAEPVNALTNLAFILAGLAALRLAARLGRLDAPVVLLSVNALCVGLGSFLFHSFATVWAAIADSGPILLFILGYFVVAMNRFGGLSWGRAALATLGFLVAMLALSAALRATVGPLIGGSQSYFPALLALLGVGLWLDRRGHPAGGALVRAAGIFGASLTARMLDRPLCDSLPLGTHFLWHLLNGYLLWTLLAALIHHGRAPARAGPAAA